MASEEPKLDYDLFQQWIENEMAPIAGENIDISLENFLKLMSSCEDVWEFLVTHIYEKSNAEKIKKAVNNAKISSENTELQHFSSKKNSFTSVLQTLKEKRKFLEVEVKSLEKEIGVLKKEKDVFQVKVSNSRKTYAALKSVERFLSSKYRIYQEKIASIKPLFQRMTLPVSDDQNDNSKLFYAVDDSKPSLPIDCDMNAEMSDPVKFNCFLEVKDLIMAIKNLGDREQVVDETNYQQMKESVSFRVEKLWSNYSKENIYSAILREQELDKVDLFIAGICFDASTKLEEELQKLKSRCILQHFESDGLWKKTLDFQAKNRKIYKELAKYVRTNSEKELLKSVQENFVSYHVNKCIKQEISELRYQLGSTDDDSLKNLTEEAVSMRVSVAKKAEDIQELIEEIDKALSLLNESGCCDEANKFLITPFENGAFLDYDTDIQESIPTLYSENERLQSGESGKVEDFMKLMNAIEVLKLEEPPLIVEISDDCGFSLKSATNTNTVQLSKEMDSSKKQKVVKICEAVHRRVQDFAEQPAQFEAGIEMNGKELKEIFRRHSV